MRKAISRVTNNNSLSEMKNELEALKKALSEKDYLINSLNEDSLALQVQGNDSNLLIVFYVQIMPDDFVMQLHRF
ncbi:hypothetical protein A1U9_03402 [Escherichia coli KTE68]|nr:hypothetical protein A1U9_03402 [Escherichia coli KTE68]